MNTKPTRKTNILKYLLVSCATILALVLVFIIWIAVFLFSGPDAMEISEYHPFRSAKARAQYLRFDDKIAQQWPVVSEEKMVETSFGQTFMRISGPTDAPPLVLLPGGGANSLLWRFNIKALSEHFRTYALDNIYDYGRSVYTRAMETPDDLASWLDELFTALGLEAGINLMGYSYGGWVAGQYALRHAQRLNKIILLAPAATVLPFSKELLKRMMLTLIPLRCFTESTIYWVWEDLVQKDEAGRKIADDRVDHLRLAYSCFKFKMPVNPTVLEDKELQSLNVPALYLVGEHEKIYPAGQAVSRLNQVAPRITTGIIPNAGHDLAIVQADLVNNKVIEFLRN